MAKLANCPICGKLYLENSFGMCAACRRETEAQEAAVAAYVQAHPRCTLEEIHRETGVAQSVILHMIRTGRLQALGVVSYPCAGCGAPITAGLLCRQCRSKFAQAVHLPPKKEAADAQEEAGFYSKYYKR